MRDRFISTAAAVLAAAVEILYLALNAGYTTAMFVKKAAADDVATTDRLLQRIHDENPSFWPHGLSRSHFDGGLYLLSKQAGMEPVGFVGWQERSEGKRKIGYYSVGVLPEHRRKEYAKRAIQALLVEKSANVDEVRAMVMTSNEPSKNLARSLDGVVLLEKAAAGGRAEIAKMLMTGLAGGTSTMLMQDNLMHPGEPMGTQAFDFSENDKSRNLMNIVNFALGAGGASLARKGFQTMKLPDKAMLGAGEVGLGLGTMITGPIAKDALMDSHRAIQGVDRLSKDLPAAVHAAKPEAFKIPNSLVTGGIALGAAGIGTAALLSVLKMRERRRADEAARGGRIRVTLPTKNPGDSETTIDLPTEGFGMSAALQGKLKRDTRQRLLLETRQRTRHRKPKDPNNPTEAEKEIMALTAEQAALDAEMGKSAAARLRDFFLKSAGAAPAVPSPPAPGTNPALRMSQEAAVAQQAAQGAATDANPQIAQAEQAAAAAEQNAQAQIAQEQQKQQAEAMQRDQAHQQELAQKDQEVFQSHQEIEMQKMEVEKAKVEMELAKAKIEAAQELEEEKKSMTDAISKGDDSAVHRMTKHRLGRIRSMVNKAAAAAERMAARPAELMPSVAQHLNDRGNEYQAHGGLASPHLYRTSFSKLGDKVYGTLARPWLMTPSQDNMADWMNLSPETMSANPDAFDSMLRMGTQFMNTPRV